jgi:hypothetical protein
MLTLHFPRTGSPPFLHFWAYEARSLWITRGVDHVYGQMDVRECRESARVMVLGRGGDGVSCDTGQLKSRREQE